MDTIDPGPVFKADLDSKQMVSIAPVDPAWQESIKGLDQCNAIIIQQEFHALGSSQRHQFFENVRSVRVMHVFCRDDRLGEKQPARGRIHPFASIVCLRIECMTGTVDLPG